MGLWCRIDCRSATPPGRPELESARQIAAHPIAGGQLVDQQAGHSTTHRLAVNEHRPVLLLRLLEPHLLAEHLLPRRHPVRPRRRSSERVTRRKGCASRPGSRPLRSGGWVFLAAAGGCGIGFWIARRLARGCGGCRRLGPGVGGRWVVGVLWGRHQWLDAWPGQGLSPAIFEPWRSSSRPRLAPSRRLNSRRFACRFSARKFRKVASPQAP